MTDFWLLLAVLGILLVILRAYYVRENAKRDKLLAEGQLQDVPADEFADLTDKECVIFRNGLSIESSCSCLYSCYRLPGFRYVL